MPRRSWRRRRRPTAIPRLRPAALGGQQRPPQRGQDVLVGRACGQDIVVKRLTANSYDPWRQRRGNRDSALAVVSTTRRSSSTCGTSAAGVPDASNKFFLTKRPSICGLDGRLSEEENRLENWLTVIRASAGTHGRGRGKQDRSAAMSLTCVVQVMYPQNRAIVGTSLPRGLARQTEGAPSYGRFRGCPPADATSGVVV